MAENTERAEKLGWLLEPPGAGQTRLFVELGEGAELTPQAQEALEQLMKELNEPEVQGFASNSVVSTTLFGLGLFQLEGHCSALKCQSHNCGTHSCGQYNSLRLRA